LLYILHTHTRARTHARTHALDCDNLFILFIQNCISVFTIIDRYYYYF